MCGFLVQDSCAHKLPGGWPGEQVLVGYAETRQETHGLPNGVGVGAVLAIGEKDSKSTSTRRLHLRVGPDFNCLDSSSLADLRGGEMTHKVVKGSLELTL